MNADTVGTILAVVGIMGGPMYLMFRAMLAAHAETKQVLADRVQASEEREEDTLRRLDRVLNLGEGANEVAKEVIKTSRTRAR